MPRLFPLRHPCASALPVLAVALSACALLAPADAPPAPRRTRHVEVRPLYVVGGHGEKGMLLRVENRTATPLRLIFHVALPASHPAPEPMFRVGDTPYFNPHAASAARCSGLQRDTTVEARGRVELESCLFPRVARGAGYEASVVVLDSASSVLERLRFRYDLRRWPRRR